jgi:acyl-coenzyme A synthetase/AMP-(fatty) acid ligase/rubrerythrin
MLCPKCQRPLEDETDGVYICCADASLQWRCTQCAKVSEGFAFPYGGCPHCGGKLELSESRAGAEFAAQDGIRKAFEIELGGRAFYQRAAAESGDAALRDLFSRFALMEGEHMETLTRRYHVDVPAPSPAFRVELAAIFAEVESRPQDPANLFRIAIGLEQRAADFFAGCAALAAPGSAEQRLYRELAAEEREHADMLGTEYARWHAGKPGLFSSDLLRPAQMPGRDPVAVPARMINAAALLLADHAADRTALCCGEQNLSYAALRASVARCAAVLQSHGVSPGDRVAIKLADGCDWVSAFLGTIWAGGVAVAVNPRIPQAEWQYILDEAGFSVILAESPDDTPAPWRERVLLQDDWRRAMAAAAAAEPVAMDPEAPAYWCHSSGTTGQPKAVVHAQRFARHIDQVSREGLGVHAGDRLYATSKLFFVYPQTNSVFAGLKIGATAILDAQWPTAASVLATVEAQHPTVLFSVPSLYRNLLHEGLAPRIARAGVRLCVSAGEALPASLREAWREQTGLLIVNGYGASETQVLVMIDAGDAQGFVPAPGVEIRPLGGAEAGTGVPTRICIRTPTRALGYLDRPQAQAEALRDGEFCPADLFARNAAGGWHFEGREDTLVKLRGRWVNLLELEGRLAGCPGLDEAAAVAVPDDDGVDALAVFYVTRPDAPPDTAGALRELAKGWPPYQRPCGWRAVPALPRTATGKLMRRKLVELWRSKAGS